MSSVTPSHKAGRDTASLLAVGTIVWLSSELMFFSGLFAAYFTLRAQSTHWPPPDVHLDTVSATIATAVAATSAVTLNILST